MKPDVRPDTGCHKRPDIRYNPNIDLTVNSFGGGSARFAGVDPLDLGEEIPGGVHSHRLRSLPFL